MPAIATGQTSQSGAPHGADSARRCQNGVASGRPRPSPRSPFPDLGARASEPAGWSPGFRRFRMATLLSWWV